MYKSNSIKLNCVQIYLSVSNDFEIIGDTV